MSKPFFPILALAVVVLVAWWIASRPEPTTPQQSEVSEIESDAVLTPAPPGFLPGDEILADYGSVNLSALDDMRMIENTIDNFRLLNHHIDARFFSTNRDIVEVLLGKEGVSHPFLSGDSSFLSPDGQLLDRWGEPLFFHLQSADRLEIRSAGPDGTMFTDDDVLLTSP